MVTEHVLDFQMRPHEIFASEPLLSKRHVDPWRTGTIVLSPYFKVVPVLATDRMNGVVGGETGGCRRKSNDDESRIPVLSPGLFRRSASLRLRGERSSPRSFPEPIAEGGQSCAKIWPLRPPSRLHSQVSVFWLSIPQYQPSPCSIRQ